MDDPNYQDCWSDAHRRWYRKRYDHYNAQWIFHDWLPAQRHDSVYDPPVNFQQNTPAVASSANAGPAYPRMGNRVEGSYNTLNPGTSEVLDPAYYVRAHDYFQEGRLFAVLFTEAAGMQSTLNAVTDYNTALSRVRYNELAHTQVRRFIVVRRKRGFCYAVPIFTYSNQGTTKPGVVPEEHSIAYSFRSTPRLLPGEQQLSKRPICIVMNEGERLVPASRIFFGIHHPIQYNVKVKDLGFVHQRDMSNLLGYWNQEIGNDTQQPYEVTEAAADDYE
ncbi:hypothetical protein IAQ61_007012 [Plenodomus lingam]|uniref:DUF6590 domain-containing protein n=1 Tax=Leptosphaeria maculans (strain JN3 / isolate v23.1.3 / race Av1-4-5-6-7-8) TaxID=985895 RepID=E5AD70_LEPMJ|nr:hypothetical protein LEMA_P012090.1 [Plenodomus lingam JN3]KAH9869799.1 hypothetical protein IAQ61_007012 [Plenodomus lingam]CBY02422.1 hypothetical protein LEMA_P012090.1 [Plenodomus lingam JN3]